MVQMTNVSDARAAFSVRLNRWLDERGFPPKGQGRQVKLAKRYGVTQKASRKWLEGEGLPRRQVIEAMARDFKVSTEEVEFGQVRSDQQAHGRTQSTTPLVGMVPVVSIDQADHDMLLPIPGETGAPPERVPTHIDDDAGAYAIEIKGTAMVSPTGPTYPDGAFVICSPARRSSAKTGQRVLVKLASGERIVRELDRDGDRQLLRPLNAQWPIVREPFEVLAVVVGCYNPE